MNFNKISNLQLTWLGLTLLFGGLASAETSSISQDSQSVYTSKGSNSMSTSESRSQFDYMSGFGLRSFPVGAAFYGDIGYSRMIWGDRKNGNVLYGFFRPALKLQTSYFVNRAEAYFDFFPVSFFGLTAGASVTSRNINLYTTIDCTTTECMGTLYRKWARAKLVLGKGNFYGVGWMRYDDLRSSTTGRDFADEWNTLVARAGGDQVLSYDVALGYTWNSHFHSGVHFTRADMLGFKNSSAMWDIYTGYRSGKWQYLAGAGVYQSNNGAIDPSVYFLMSWNGQRGYHLD